MDVLTVQGEKENATLVVLIDDNEAPIDHHDKLTMTPKKPTPANLVTSPMNASPTDTGSSLRGAD